MFRQYEPWLYWHLIRRAVYPYCPFATMARDNNTMLLNKHLQDFKQNITYFCQYYTEKQAKLLYFLSLQKIKEYFHQKLVRFQSKMIIFTVKNRIIRVLHATVRSWGIHVWSGPGFGFQDCCCVIRSQHSAGYHDIAVLWLLSKLALEKKDSMHWQFGKSLIELILVEK